MSESKKITLISSDNDKFPLDASVAMEFGAIKNFVQDPDVNAQSIPLTNVSSKCLTSMIKYFESHRKFRSENASMEDIKAFDNKFTAEMDDESLKEAVIGANFLIAKDLLDMLNQAVADRIKDRGLNYVRRFFGVENDYTPEEEKEMKKKYAWTFEGIPEDD